MQQRKVIVMRNTFTQEITVFSNRKKVFAQYEKRLTISYNQLCIAIKTGLKIKVPGFFGLEDEVVFKEYIIK